MSNISGQLIKDSYNYVLQSDLITGIVYRIGGDVPTNPKFISGLTINTSLTYSDGSEIDGYVLTCDTSGNATWKPVSGATSSSGVTSVTATNGISGNVTTGAIILVNTAPDQIVTISGGTGITTGGTYPNFTLINSSPDQTVIITGGTNIQITGTYPSFGVNFTGSTSSTGDYLPLSGGTVTGATNFTAGLTANTISATTYYNLPTDVYVTGGTYTSGNAIFTNNTGGTFTVSGFNTGGGGGQIFYLNISQSKNGNRYLSTTASTAVEQSTGVTISAGGTSTIASFQSDELNITLIPGGVWAFYLHSYKSDTNASFNIFVEVYKRTSGGTETLLFTTDPTAVTSNSPNPTMQLSDAYFSGSPILVSDSIVAVVRATNTSNQSHVITLFSEGTQHYSYAVSSIPTQQGLTCDTLSGCSIIQTIQTDVSNKFDKSGGTITGSVIIESGLTANTISATTYKNLPLSGLTEGSNISITGSNGNFTVSFTGTTGSNFTGGTVSGATRFTGGLTANTISATTYQNLPFSGTVNGGGTSNYLPKWTGATGLGNSQIRDDGTYIGIGNTPLSSSFITIFDSTVTTATTASLKVSTNSNTKKTIFVEGGGVGVSSYVFASPTAKAFEARVTNGTNAYGIYATISPENESAFITNGIGGYFEVGDIYDYGEPTNKYSLQLKDGTEGLNKVLTSVTSDGKANWSNTVKVSSITATTISATTYQNLPATPFLPFSGGTINGNLMVNGDVRINGVGSAAIQLTAYNSVTSYGVFSYATRGTNAYGVYGVASPDEFPASITNGIGGYFAADNSQGYENPTNRYSVQLVDGTEGLNKVLTCVTSDGKANWETPKTNGSNLYLFYNY